MIRKIVAILFLIFCLGTTHAQNSAKLPNANIISMFMKDAHADINGNYVVNFFIGELSVFLSSCGIDNVYSRNVESAYNSWYMMVEFNGRTTLSSNGTYRYEYRDVGLFVIPADKSKADQGYWIDLGDFTVGTGKGDLVRYFKNHICH